MKQAGLRSGLMLAMNWILLLLPSLALAFGGGGAKLGPWIPAYSLLLSIMTLLLAVPLVRSWCALFLIHLPFLCLSPVFVWYVFNFSAPPDENAFAVLLTSSIDEFAGFVDIFHLQLPLWASIGALGLYLVNALGLRGHMISFRLRRAVLWLAPPTLVFILCMPTKTPNGLAVDMGENMREFLTSSYPLGGGISLIGGVQGNAEAFGLFDHKEKYNAHLNFSDDGPRTHILVIGESARADHFHLLGYPRQTTPELERVDSLLSFTKTFSTANLTSLAVPMLITGSAPASYSPRTIRGNLVDLANEAGYFTAWLSNQGLSLYKIFHPQPQVWRQPVDVTNWGGDHATPDDLLLAPLDEMLERSSTRKFIVVHTYGSHLAYPQRLPDDGFHFSGRDRQSVSAAIQADKSGYAAVDAYDDTILHTDFVLNQIIQRASLLPGEVTVTYIPDHGEALQAVEGHATHGFKDFTVSELHIPLLFWANAAFRTVHAEQWQAMQSHKDLVVSQDAVFYTAASLLGIEFTAQDPSRDLTSKAFRPIPIRQLQFRTGGDAQTRRLQEALDWRQACKRLDACE